MKNLSEEEIFAQKQQNNNSQQPSETSKIIGQTLGMAVKYSLIGLKIIFWTLPVMLFKLMNNIADSLGGK